MSCAQPGSAKESILFTRTHKCHLLVHSASKPWPISTPKLTITQDIVKTLQESENHVFDAQCNDEKYLIIHLHLKFKKKGSGYYLQVLMHLQLLQDL